MSVAGLYSFTGAPARFECHPLHGAELTHEGGRRWRLRATLRTAPEDSGGLLRWLQEVAIAGQVFAVASNVDRVAGHWVSSWSGDRVELGADVWATWRRTPAGPVSGRIGLGAGDPVALRSLAWPEEAVTGSLVAFTGDAGRVDVGGSLPLLPGQAVLLTHAGFLPFVRLDPDASEPLWKRVEAYTTYEQRRGAVRDVYRHAGRLALDLPLVESVPAFRAAADLSEGGLTHDVRNGPALRFGGYTLGLR